MTKKELERQLDNLISHADFRDINEEGIAFLKDWRESVRHLEENDPNIVAVIVEEDDDGSMIEVSFNRVHDMNVIQSISMQIDMVARKQGASIYEVMEDISNNLEYNYKNGRNEKH